jgi:hypothetical protein
MNVSELFGWTAAALTLLTFATRNLCAARIVAIAANACFIAYAVTGGFLLHVLALHLALVPINLMRLAEIRRARTRGCHGKSAAPAASRSGKERDTRLATRAVAQQ